MKHALKRLGVLGPGQYRLLVEELRKAQTRSAKLTEALEAARVELRGLKGKADEAQKALRESRDESARHARRAEKLAADAERVRANLERKHDHDHQKLVQVDERRSATVENMKQRLIAAEQDLIIARESLMAVEVKLDILEGAANVLDVRTRMASRRSVATGTGASV